MRRIIFVMTTGLLLVGAGVAVAHGFDGRSVKQVSATFAATSTGKLRTANCTGADGTYARSQATYSGSVTSTEPSLNGPARIEAASLVNTTTGVGSVWGVIRIDTADGRHTSAHFDGVLTHGSVVGLADGRARTTSDESRLVANFSADYTAAGGFANGKLGGGTAAGDAILIARGGCEQPKAPKPERVKARGAITTVSPTSISVAGVTCSVPTGRLQGDVAKLKVSDVVEIECEVANGANTLTHVSGGHHK